MVFMHILDEIDYVDIVTPPFAKNALYKAIHYNAVGHVIMGNSYSCSASFILGYEVEFCLGFFVLTDLKEFVSTFFFLKIIE